MNPFRIAAIGFALAGLLFVIGGHLPIGMAFVCIAMMYIAISRNR